MFRLVSGGTHLDHSGQRLLLQLSSSFVQVVKQLQVDIDSGLYVAAPLEGLSRLPVIAEGIDAPELTGQLKWVDKRDPKSGMRMLSAATGTATAGNAPPLRIAPARSSRI